MDAQYLADLALTLYCNQQNRNMRQQEFPCVVCGTATTLEDADERTYIIQNNGSRVRFDYGVGHILQPLRWKGDRTYIPGFLVCANPACRLAYLDKIPAWGYFMQHPQVVPERYASARLEQWNNPDKPQLHAAYQQVKAWLDAPITKGWLICGHVGTTKTSLASAIAYELRKRDKTVLFAEAATVNRDMRLASNTFRVDEYERLMDNYLNHDVVILDDVTDLNWEYEAAAELFSKLYNEKKLLIITSNEEPSGIKMEQRFLSRLIEQTNLIVLSGEDMRQQ